MTRYHHHQSTHNYNICVQSSHDMPRSDIIRFRYIELYNEVGFGTKTMTPLTYRRMPAGWKMIMTVTILLFAVIPILNLMGCRVDLFSQNNILCW